MFHDVLAFVLLTFIWLNIEPLKVPCQFDFTVFYFRIDDDDEKLIETS